MGRLSARRGRVLAWRPAPPPTGAALSVCIVSRGEAALVPGCAWSVRAIADEVVVVDVGARQPDGGPEHAPQIGPLSGVGPGRRRGSRPLRSGSGANRPAQRPLTLPTWPSEAASARLADRTVCVAVPAGATWEQAAQAGVEASRGDWILLLEADERLGEAEPWAIRQRLCAAAQSGVAAFRLPVFESLDPAALRLVGLERRPRLFRPAAARCHGVLRPDLAVPGDTAADLDLAITAIPGTPGERSRANWYRRAVQELEPAGAMEEFRRARELERLGLGMDAAARYRRALEACTSRPRPEFWARAAACLRLGGDPEAAGSVVAAGLCAEPLRADLWLERGHCLMDAFRFTEAVEALQRAVALDPGPRRLRGWQPWAVRARAETQVGLACEALDDTPGAEAALRRALEGPAAAWEALEPLGRLLIRRDGGDAAEAELRRLAPSDTPAALAGCWLALNGAGRPRRALSYGRALALADPRPEFQELHRENLWDLGRYWELVGAGPSRVEEALALALLGRRASAIECLEGAAGAADAAAVRCLVQGPGAAAAWAGPAAELEEALWRLVGRLCRLGEMPRVRSCLDALRTLGVAEGRVALQLGKVFFQTGLGDLAAECLNEACRTGSLDAEGFALLGEIALTRGLRDDAVAFFARAVLLEPERAVYRWRLDEARTGAAIPLPADGAGAGSGRR
jgi:tetratricopeptide (TPR) repeat protein